MLVQNAGDRLQECGFAGRCRSEECTTLSLRNRQRNICERWCHLSVILIRKRFQNYAMSQFKILRMIKAIERRIRLMVSREVSLRLFSKTGIFPCPRNPRNSRAWPRSILSEIEERTRGKRIETKARARDTTLDRKRVV